MRGDDERQIRHALLTASFGKERQNETGRILTFWEFVPRFISYSENNNKHSSVFTGC
ncbi:integrase [Cystobacter fuscus]|uniref:Integrase n=1 Tax=Cystobacter fuscus TaxID=43 RepID=A0A250JCS1_9BACT|nr:integrase [Cystobacter fuscus]